MRKVGDIISWDTKDGKKCGEIITVRVRYEYVVAIEPEREKHILMTEVEEHEAR